MTVAVVHSLTLRLISSPHFKRRCSSPKPNSFFPFTRRSLPNNSCYRVGRRAFATSSSGADDDAVSAQERHHLYKEQMEQLRNEREELFGFTAEEQSAWGKVEGHKHDADFLTEINQARKELQNIDDSSSDESDGGEDAAVDFQNSASHLTHVSLDGQSVRMVDVGQKPTTTRHAVASSTVSFPPAVMQTLEKQNWQSVKKGPIFETARLAGIMAAKKTSDLIPLCHPLPLDQVAVSIDLSGNKAIVTCECRVTHKTGVEMEALTGASVAALTIYDMVKAVSHDITIEDTRLISKKGGKRSVDNSHEPIS